MLVCGIEEPILRDLVELKYHRILFHAQEGQQSSTNGLLSGKKSSFLYHRVKENFDIKAGIGTYNIPEIVKPWMAKLSRILDMMIGIHLDAHIMGMSHLSFSPSCGVGF